MRNWQTCAQYTVIPALVAGISPSQARTSVQNTARLPRRSAAMTEVRLCIGLLRREAFGKQPDPGVNRRLNRGAYGVR